MSVLVLGATGLIGNRLVRTLKKDFEVFGTTRKPKLSKKFTDQMLEASHWLLNSSPTDFSVLEREVRSLKPNIIVNCLGVIKSKLSMFDVEESISVNALFPHQLSKLCRNNGIRLIQLSTDCVFSGDKGNYVESDVPNPVDIYGRTKSLGELVNDHDLTIRTSFVGREIDSFTNLFEWAIRNKNSRIVGYPRAIYSGLTTLALANVIRDVIHNQQNLVGLWHVSSESISKYQLLSLLNSVLSLNIDIEIDETFVCNRSLNSDAFRNKTTMTVPSWTEMLDDFAKDQDWYDTFLSGELSSR